MKKKNSPADIKGIRQKWKMRFLKNLFMTFVVFTIFVLLLFYTVAIEKEMRW